MSTELLSKEEIQRAADLLKSGKLVAFPTETVYGLGASIFNLDAIQSIFAVKGRPADNPLIAHVHSLQQVEEIAQEIPEEFYRLASCFFPGPLALILKKLPCVPLIASAGLASIAVRMPSHPIASKLIALTGSPLVAPSANLSGKPSATCAKHVMQDFDGKIAAVIDGGKADIGIESTVISLLGSRPVLLRPGHIAKEAVEEVLGDCIEVASSLSAAPLSPGMKYRHYAPRTPIKVFHTFEALKNHLDAHPRCAQAMLLSREPIAAIGLDRFPLVANEFYSLLRHADEKHYCEILILCDEAIRKDAGLMNRLTRSAGI